MNIQVGSIWKEIDEDDPQTYTVIGVARGKITGKIDHYIIEHTIDKSTCRVDETFFEYAKEQK